MTRTDQIAWQYEDALFALMMQDVVEHEGAQILRQVKALELDPAAAVPELVNTRMEQSIHSFFARKKAKRFSRQMRSTARKLAVAALVSSFLLTSAFAYSEEFRVGALNLMIDVFDQGTQITFRSSQSQHATMNRQENSLTDGIPVGYDETMEYSDSDTKFIALENEIGAVIEIDMQVYREGVVYIDTEDCIQKACTVDGKPATLYVKSEEAVRERHVQNAQIKSDITLLWFDDTVQTMTTIRATNLDEEEIIRIAEGEFFQNWRNGE